MGEKTGSGNLAWIGQINQQPDSIPGEGVKHGPEKSRQVEGRELAVGHRSVDLSDDSETRHGGGTRDWQSFQSAQWVWSTGIDHKSYCPGLKHLISTFDGKNRSLEDIVTVLAKEESRIDAKHLVQGEAHARSCRPGDAEISVEHGMPRKLKRGLKVIPHEFRVAAPRRAPRFIIGQLLEYGGHRNSSAFDDRWTTIYARINLNALAHFSTIAAGAGNRKSREMALSPAPPIFGARLARSSQICSVPRAGRVRRSPGPQSSARL